MTFRQLPLISLGEAFETSYVDSVVVYVFLDPHDDALSVTQTVQSRMRKYRISYRKVRIQGEKI